MAALFHLSLNHIRKAIADAGDIQDKARVRGFGLDFLAQLGDIDVQTVHALALPLLSPEMAHQYLAGEEFPSVGNKNFEQVELGWRQRDFVFVGQHLPLGEIHRERADAKGRLGLAGDLRQATRATRTRASTSSMPKGLAT